jgi:hypothetical protein
VLITVPLVGALLLMRRWFHPHNYPQLAVQMSIAGAVYGLGVLWVFKTNRAFKVGELSPQEKSAAIASGLDAPIEAYQEDL